MLKMVVINEFKDVLDLLPHIETLNLPAFKQNAFKVEYCEYDPKQTSYVGPEPPLPFANSKVFEAQFSHWRRLTALDGDCKAVFEVAFNVKGSNFKFKAGDTIGIIPHNDSSDVDLLISHLDLVSKADVPYVLSVDSKQKAKVPAHVPVKSTLRHVLTYCLDLRSVLKKLFLVALSKYTKDEKEKRILEYLCSKEGASAYTNHILEKNLCLLDLLSIFKSCKPPIEIILGSLARLLPRPYSIVNSGLNNCDEIKICFSVMTINNRRGLTTGWLENMILNEELNLEQQMMNLNITNSHKTAKKVPIYLRKNLNQFCLPESHETPLILISPGTGVAPFIGFLEEREHHKRNNEHQEFGDIWLFFGCRNPELDFIYEKELNGFRDSGILTEIKMAYSRVEGRNAKYVQDALRQNGEEVAKLIQNGACIYVCGDLKAVATQVKTVLIQCLIEHASMNPEDAEKLLSDMQKDKIYLVDAWS